MHPGDSGDLPSDPGQLPARDAVDELRAGGGHLLQDAQAFLQRGLCLDPSQSWTNDERERQLRDEVACLADFAESRRLWLPAETVQGLSVGGQEHDYKLLGDPDPLWICRVTKDGYGFYPQAHPILHISPGTPFQYFTRMLLMEQLHSFLRCELEGFVRRNDQIIIVTRQIYIPGRPLTEETRDDSPKRSLRLIEHWFQQRGYQKLHLSQSVGPSMAWYHREENIAVFDAKPANILIWEDALFPVDVIPVQPAGGLLKKILAAL